MKKIFILVILLILTGILFAQTTAPKLIKPVDPAILGRGYTAIADPGGYQAFFHNPAGFAKDNHLTVLSLNPWLFTDKSTIELLQDPQQKADEIADTFNSPDTQAAIDAWLAGQTEESLSQLLADVGYTQQDVINAGGVDPFFNGLTDQEIISIAGIVLEQEELASVAETIALPSGAARVGTSVGVAFTAKGFGLGLFGVVDGQLEGTNILTAEGRAAAQITLHAGYALKLNLGIMQVYAGAQVRPTLVYTTQVDASFIPEVMNSSGDLVNTLLNKPGIAAFGAGLDAGVIVDFWWLNFGLSADNLLSFMKIQDNVTIQNILDDPGSLIPETKPEIVQNIALNFGIGLHPKIGNLNKLLDPAIYVDFQDINGVIAAAKLAGDDTEAAKAEILDLVKIGADVKLLSFLRARAGFADGYFTLGAGIELPFINVNLASTFGTPNIEDISDFGLAAEVAIRF